MDELKIECDTNEEKKESIKLLLDLGYSDFETKDKYLLLKTYPDGKIMTVANFNNSRSCALTTIQQLRDMVALKNNNVHDSNYIDGYEQEWYITEDGQRNVWNRELNKWSLEMEQEWLYREGSEYKFIKCDDEFKEANPSHVKWISIPDGATSAIESRCSDELIFHKESSMWGDGEWNNGYRKFESFISSGYPVIWQRATQPEELPFIDDEVVYKNSFSEDNTAVVSAWDKQEGGAHYKNLKIQPMQYALENKLDYAQSNVVKYVTRHASKNGKEDLLKAIHNIELMIEHYYS